MVVWYNHESRHWRDATRLRGYGWAGYSILKRVMHYWGAGPAAQGRVTETMYDGHGNAVGGLVFNILFSTIGHVARSFQVHQHEDGSVVFKVVPFTGRTLPGHEEQVLRAHAERYLPGAPFTIQIVDEIPLTSAGKRRVVVCDWKPSKLYA